MGQSSITVPSGSSITIQQGAYICADEISVSGTFTYFSSSDVCVTPTGSGSISDVSTPTINSVAATANDGYYKIGDVIPVTITFSESVTVTGTPQLTFETGDTDAVVDYASGSGSTTLTFNYTVASGHISSDLDYISTSALALNGGTIKDAAGNAATLTLSSPGGGTSLGSNKDIVVDGIIPTASTLSPADDATAASPNSNLTITFSEDVAAGSGNLIIKKSSDDSEYESISASSDKISLSSTVATVNPAKDMETSTQYYVTVATGMFKDVAGNEYAGFTDATSWNFTTSAVVDVTAPSAASVTVNDGSADDVDSQNTTKTIIANWSGFTDEVGIASYDWAIGSTSGGTEVKDWTSVGNVTTATDSTLTLTNGTKYYVSVRANDGAGNQSEVVTSDGVTVEVAGPILTLSSGVTAATNSSSITFKVVFSKTITGFESSDVTVGNGTIGNFAGSDTSYSFDVTPTAEGKVTVDIDADVATDSEGVGNPAVTQYSFIYDITAPVVGTVIDGAGIDIDYQISTTTIKGNWSGFSDVVSGISKYEWAIKYVLGVDVLDLKEWTEAGVDTFAVDSSLTLENGKTYFVFVRATDQAGNVSSEINSDGVTITENAPTVAISADALYATNQSTFSVTVTFSDDVTGFDDSDITVNNGTMSNFAGSGKDYSFDVTPTAEGNVTIDIANEAAQDSDNIGNVAALRFTMIYDITKPIIGSILDGVLDDLDWFNAPDSLRATWTGFVDSLSGIGEYEYAIGTGAGSTNILDWTSAGSDTTVTPTGLSLSDGITYYTSVHAIDMAGNVSADTSTNGVTIDMSPPTQGIVNDGKVGDIERTSSLTTLAANWSGFDDSLSGIAYFEYAVGTVSGDTNVVAWTTTGQNMFYFRDDLTLEVDTVYYHSVRAHDVVGNTSDPVSSDGFIADQSPPALLAVSPGEESPLSLTSDSEITFTFTEPIDSYELNIDTDVTEDFAYEIEHVEDNISVTLTPPIASMDSIRFTLNNVTDIAGFVTDEITVTFGTAMLADYNNDRAVNVTDLSAFVSGWQNKDYSYELGPVSGEAPHLIPNIDAQYNLRDVMTFFRMFDWSSMNTSYMARLYPLTGAELQVEQTTKNLTVQVPDNAIAGEIVIQYQTTGTDISFNETATSEKILIPRKNPEKGELAVTFGYLEETGQKQLLFNTQYHTSNSSNLTLSYIFYSNDNTVISQGTKDIELTPVPEDFALHQNYPNPFNPTTTILYDLPEAATVHLVIYDVLGRQVRTLVNQDLTAGYHKAVWDATDDMGRPLSGGLYIYRIQAGGYSKTMKMVLLK